MARPRRRSRTTPSLFPFLSVIACIIGALTLILAASAVGQMATGTIDLERYERLEEEIAITVRDHVAGCDECAELAEAMAGIIDAGSGLAELEPPSSLADDLSASPCRRWLGLLFQAVDREISQRNLERLLTHLEACPVCRRAWQDLTLIHQVSEAMEPPPGFVNLCIRAREKRPGVRPILNRRMATAAAYLLAVLTSLIIGNPVTLARSQAGTTVGRVAEALI